MNLFDLPEKELFDFKEVGLVIRDIALSRIPNRRLSASDQVIYSTEDFEVLLISNSVVLKRPAGSATRRSRFSRFAFAANYDNINDDRQWSTRLNVDRDRYVIRYTWSNSILKVTDRSVFFNTVQGNEEYIDVINETINYCDMEPEIFQRALIEDKNTMNTVMLNYLFRRDLPYHQAEPGVTLHGFLNELELVAKAIPHIQELRKLC